MSLNIQYMTKALGCTMMLAAMTSCGSVFDDGDLCPPLLQVKFVDDMNMSFTDRFSDEITELQLYVFDANNTLVQIISEQDSSKFDANYSIPLNNLPSGQYSFVAWSNLNHGTPTYELQEEDIQVGVTTRQQLGARLKELAHSVNSVDHRMQQTWNGFLDLQTLAVKDTTVIVPLTHCVNDLQILLQRPDGMALDAENYSIRIYGHNGEMNYDANLKKISEVEYLPYQSSLEKDHQGVYSRWDLSTGRLTTDEPMQLEIVRNDGAVVLDIPLAPYALLVKDLYGKEMTDEEFLLRQDNYKIKFILDDATGLWNGDNLHINDWRVVTDNVKF